MRKPSLPSALFAVVVALLLAIAAPAQSPNTLIGSDVFTTTGTGASHPLIGYAYGSVSVIGTSLTTVTFNVQGTNNGSNWFALSVGLYTAPATTQTSWTTTTNQLYGLTIPAITAIRFQVTALTGTSVMIRMVGSSASIGAAAAGGGTNPSGIGTQSTVNTTAACVTASGTSPSSPSATPNVEPIVNAGVLRIRPTGINKLITIFGASVGQGDLASTYGNSWGGLFTTAMTAKGYTVLNSSCSGNTTGQLIARFYTDVAPFRPDIVIICPYTVNDGYNIVTWRNNVIQLAKMVRQIGSIPVVLQPGADTNYTLQQFQNVKDVEKLLAAMNIPTLDFLSATGDPTTGHYLSGLGQGDGLHMTDAGQLQAYNSIPLTMFDQLLYGATLGALPNNCTSTTHGWKSISGLANSVPMTLTIDRAAAGFTFSSCMNIPAAGASLIAFMSFQGAGEASDGNLRLRQNTNGTVSIASTSLNPICTSTVTPTGFHTIAFSYQATTNVYTLYSDGVSICSGTGGVAAGTTTVSTVAFFNDIPNPTFPAKGFVLGPTYFYRTALFPEQLLEMAVGGFTKASALEWGAAFNTYASSAINVAYTPPNLALTANNLAMVVNQQFDSQ